MQTGVARVEQRQQLCARTHTQTHTQARAAWQAGSTVSAITEMYCLRNLDVSSRMVIRNMEGNLADNAPLRCSRRGLPAGRRRLQKVEELAPRRLRAGGGDQRDENHRAIKHQKGRHREAEESERGSDHRGEATVARAIHLMMTARFVAYETHFSSAVWQ